MAIHFRVTNSRMNVCSYPTSLQHPLLCMEPSLLVLGWLAGWLGDPNPLTSLTHLISVSVDASLSHLSLSLSPLSLCLSHLAVVEIRGTT